ncbi:MAG: hypothetical protein ACW98F_03530 [Candidatus Hodarchaeales archaeon]|jgi:hypothetical protein
MAESAKELVSALLITTSHNPPHFLRRVSKLLSFSLPFSKRINRGSLNIKEIRNFCWNTGIHKLIIVQGAKETDSVSLSCYNFFQSPHQLNVKIELSNFNFPRKGEKDTRVEGQQMSVQYAPETPEEIKESIHDYIKPLIHSMMDKPSKSNLILKFRNYTDGKLQGEVVRTHSPNNSPLYSFEVKMTQEVT